MNFCHLTLTSKITFRIGRTTYAIWKPAYAKQRLAILILMSSVLREDSLIRL